MDERGRHAGDYRLLTGLALGSVVGAGVTLWLAPRAAAEIRAWAVDTARSLGHAASERYRDARLRLGETVGGIARKGQGLRNNAFDKVARVAHGVEAGARGVQHFAVDAKKKVG